ncbi:hypothetical protein TcCL_NonESM02962 [Trypanosoma cruzi]|nr:hypothetical protein TcCL_NonESM02962 [Trypanosoma cruzi]
MLDCSVVMTAFFTIAMGMLLIDLSSLQENMVCSANYGNASTCPEVFFSQSYHAARMKFKDAAKEAKAEWKQHTVLQEEGFEYSIDTAFVRGKKAKNLLIHMSGTRGVDGFTGSAVQVKLLREWNSSRGDGPSVLFVHAVNPYGMAHFRPYNENNVDLSRNYLSPEEWSHVLERDNANNSGYNEIVAPLLMSRAPRFIDRYAFFTNSSSGLSRRDLVRSNRLLPVASITIPMLWALVVMRSSVPSPSSVRFSKHMSARALRNPLCWMYAPALDRRAQRRLFPTHVRRGWSQRRSSRDRKCRAGTTKRSK